MNDWKLKVSFKFRSTLSAFIVRPTGLLISGLALLINDNNDYYLLLYIPGTPGQDYPHL